MSASQAFNSARNWAAGIFSRSSAPKAALAANAVHLTAIMLAALEGLARNDLGQSFFAVDPVTAPGWSSVIEDQTPPPLPADMPVSNRPGAIATTRIPCCARSRDTGRVIPITPAFVAL